MKQRLLGFFDLETGGLKPDRHPILSIGATITDIEGNEIGEEFHTYLLPDPSLELDPEAMAYNKLDMNIVNSEGVNPVLGITNFMEWMITFSDERGQPTFCNWCVNFDLLFIYLAMARYNILNKIPSKYCTDVKSMAIGAGYKFRSMPDLHQKLGGADYEKHNALADAKVAASIYRTIIKENGIQRK